jgi:HSP20 family protein
MAETMTRTRNEASGIVPAETIQAGACYAPRVDIYETADELVFSCDLPGVRPADVELRFENGTLSLYAKAAPQPAAGAYLLEEYGVGDFSRSFTVNAEIDPSKITAEYKYGVLTIHLPRAERVKPRKIAVKAG